MSTPALARKVVAAVAVLLLLAGMTLAARTGLANLNYVRAEHEASSWRIQGSQPTLESILRAEEAIHSSLRYSPNDSDVLSLAAQINGWKGFILAGQQNNPSLAQSHYAETLNLLRHSLRLRPAQAATWALLAEYKTLQGERDQEWHLAKEKALEFGGADIKLVLRMTTL